jgi:hypothetical protein
MSRIIHFTADDLGLDEQTNLAIEQAHQRGVLTAASLMLGQPGTAHAVVVARRNPRLHIGFHFHACDSLPLTRKRWPWGNSTVGAGIAIGLWPPARELMQRELAAQWNQFLTTGLRCSFINGHQHLHVHPVIARQMHSLLSGQFSGWVRSLEARFFDRPEHGNLPFRWLRGRSQKWLRLWPKAQQTNSLWGMDRTFCMRADEIGRVLPTLSDGVHEFMFHPRRQGDADHRALLELKAACSDLPNSTATL